MPSNLSEEKFQSLMRQNTSATPEELFKAGPCKPNEVEDIDIGANQAGSSVSCGAQNDMISARAVNDRFEDSNAENNATDATVHTNKVQSQNSWKDDNDILLNKSLTSPFVENNIETDTNIVPGHDNESENDDANDNRYTQESEL